VLSSGVSSRLYQKFVKEKELALSVVADANEQRGPALFWFSIMSRPTTDLGELERLLQDEILRVQDQGIADWELKKVKMQLRRQRAQQLYSSRSRANALGHFAVYYNDPNLVNSVWRKYDAVTLADLQRVARLYFKDSTRTIVTTLPKAVAKTTGAVER
jgi:predicted Zn-dependent peptidase